MQTCAIERTLALAAAVTMAACGSNGSNAAPSDGGNDAGLAQDGASPTSDGGNDAGLMQDGTPPTSDGAVGFGFAVSNVTAPPAGDGGAPPDFDLTASCSIDGESGALSGCGVSQSVVVFGKETTSGGSVGVLYVHDLTVESAATFSVTGNLPLVIVATDQVNVFGKVSVAATAGVGVAGGGQTNGLTGVGSGNGAGLTATGKGPGGGSFCGAGGAGGNGENDAGTGGGAAAGATYGTAILVPLIAGSSGAGNSNANSYVGGAGGGAIQISAKNAITVSGAVLAGGGGGGPSANTSGGSGGAILLEAPSVTVSGVLEANGGGGGPGGSDATPNATPAAGGMATNSGGTSTGGTGAAGTTVTGAEGALNGGGGGGAGRIRINTSGSNATLTGATISPAIGSACASQGALGS